MSVDKYLFDEIARSLKTLTEAWESDENFTDDQLYLHLDEMDKVIDGKSTYQEYKVNSHLTAYNNWLQ